MSIQKQEIKDFFELYFSYVGDTEAPRIYHRWALLSCVATLLSRNVAIPFGHWVVYPNMYIMLMGSPGTRKDTAIRIATKAIADTGYDRFSADRSSKERLLIDLLRTYTDADEEEIYEIVLENIISEQFIVTGEFTDFVGKNNIEFLTMLAKLWDCPPHYKHPKINSKSIIVPNPTINILSGNTAQGYALAMPPEAMGQGFMSRLIHVHAEPTGHKITFPKPPEDKLSKELTVRFNSIKHLRGTVSYTEEAKGVLDRLYKEYPGIDDYRFKYYNTRRFTHLLKLALAVAAGRLSLNVTADDAIAANTILHHTEARMPKALGEFGKARNADIANAIMDIMNTVNVPVTIRYLWRQVQQDLNRIEELQEIVRNLQSAGKIQLIDVSGKQGYVPKRSYENGWKPDLLWNELLSAEERS